MKKIIVLTAGLLVSFGAFAQALNQAIPSWKAPTAYVDNTPLTPDQITEYTVWYGTSSGNYTSSVVVPSASGVTPATVTITGLTANVTYYFTVTATTENGQTSNFSNEVNKYIPTTNAAPNAPLLLSITIQPQSSAPAVAIKAAKPTVR